MCRLNISVVSFQIDAIKSHSQIIRKQPKKLEKYSNFLIHLENTNQIDSK